ncbi:MAG TPA: M23 family metallopeptidase [Chitinophagales bacterium]|jgi:hypothetical protein|nr:M23 family metallopeptidase [Chitinophagales bacterium]HQW78582.1 M23 family metallopeptidase [Chitinophagales bacterium]HRB66931.1 M23 family metallopeptidase [Chitinophagales bacterium]HRB68627.1 M23 family metallopeptidase [Chitinophagales bacterium]
MCGGVPIRSSIVLNIKPLNYELPEFSIKLVPEAPIFRSFFFSANRNFFFTFDGTMSMSKLNLFFCLLFFSLMIHAQSNKKDAWIMPMDLPFHLAGTFAEPRENHFHSGIDIKTNGLEGQPIFAIADGYISRIRVSPFGYGKAIYITHNNGLTSVYGHVSAFYNHIEKYVYQQLYAIQKSEIDLPLKASILPVKQGDTIAFSGNTGGSTAPHLHFEIRNTQTEHALNPLDFYPTEKYLDTIPPIIQQVKVSASKNKNASYNALIQQGAIWTTIEPIEVEKHVPFTFSLLAFDKQDTSANKNGIKSMKVYIGDSLCFQYRLSEIDFDKTRMCNAFVDYDELKNNHGYFYNCYQLTGNTLPIYSSSNQGYFTLNKDTITLIVYCYDDNENKTILHLNFISKEIKSTITANSKTQHLLSIASISKPHTLTVKNLKMEFPNNTFYNATQLKYTIHPSKNKTLDTFIIHHPTQYIPLHKSATLRWTSFVKINRNKLVIVRQSKNGIETALPTTYNEKYIYAETKELGTFYLKYDTIIPEITQLKITSTVISAIITDNLSGIKTYQGFVDNAWVFFYHDAKNNNIEYKLDKPLNNGEHKLQLIVTDKVGNINTITQTFIIP